MSEVLLIEEVDFSALRRLSQTHYLSSWVSSVIATFGAASGALEPDRSELIQAVKVLAAEGRTFDLLAEIQTLFSAYGAEEQCWITDPCDQSLLSELHFITSSDGEYAIFHPPTLTLLRSNALTTAILASCQENISMDTLAERYRVPDDEIRSLIVRIKRILESRPLAQVVEETPESLQKLVFVMNNTCNMQCRYCYADKGSYGRETSRMSVEVVCQTIDRVWERYKTVNTLMFFGGEPTLNPEAIQACCERLMELQTQGTITNLPLWGLVTNGLTLSRQMLDLIRRYKLVVTVSLDGPPTINDSLRLTRDGVGAFQRVADSIRRIQESTNGQEPSKIEATYTEAHRKAGIRMLDLVDYFEQEFNIRDVHIAPVTVEPGHDLAWDSTSNVDTLNEMVRVLIDGWRTGSRKQTQLVTACLNTLLTRRASSHFCGAGLNELTIFPNGDVFPCYMFPYDKFHMGNTADKHIFDDECFLGVQDRFRGNTKEYLSACRQCWAKSFCHVCLKTSYVTNQTIDQIPEYACALNRSVVEATLLALSHMSVEPDSWEQLCWNIAEMANDNITKHLKYWT